MTSPSNPPVATTSSELQEAALLSKSLSPKCPVQERENAYLKVISYSTSPSVYLRKLVGKLVPQYFVEFDSLQERAVDAICDLCEDSEKEIRSVGYNAFEQISRVANSWVRRNTDVLIQLLQIDAEDEILVLRRLIATHIDINVSALSVIIDSLSDPGVEARLKIILIDILIVEGTQWRNDNMPLPDKSTYRSGQKVSTESEGGRILREGLNLILSQSPPLPLLEKIYSLLFLLPLPSTAQHITHILSYNYPNPLPLSLFEIAQRHSSTAETKSVDPRSFVRFYFEQLSDPSPKEIASDLRQEKELLSWVNQWAERERNGSLKQRIEGDEDVWTGENKEAKKKIVQDGQERWQKVLDGLAHLFSSRVLPLLRSGRRDRNGLDLPFQALEVHMLILFYITRIPSVVKRSIDPDSQLVQYINQRIGPGRPQESSRGNMRLAQSNVWFLLDFFRAPLLNSKDASWSNRRITFSWEAKQTRDQLVTSVSSNTVSSTSQSLASKPMSSNLKSQNETSSAPPPSASAPRPAAPTHSSSSDLLQRVASQPSQKDKGSSLSPAHIPPHLQQRPSPIPKSVNSNAQDRRQPRQVANSSTPMIPSPQPLPTQREGPSAGLGFSIKGRASSGGTAAGSPTSTSPAATPSLRDRLAPSMNNSTEKDGSQDARRPSNENWKKRKNTGSASGRRKR